MVRAAKELRRHGSWRRHREAKETAADFAASITLEMAAGDRKSKSGPSGRFASLRMTRVLFSTKTWILLAIVEKQIHQPPASRGVFRVTGSGRSLK
jgi:hypothetical protein